MNSRTQRAGRNVLVTVLTQLIGWALTFAVTLFLPRYIGSDGLGKLAVASAFASLFFVIVPLGTSSVLVKEIARDNDRTTELLATALAIRIPMGIGIAVLASLCAVFFGYSHPICVLVIVSSVAMIVFSINDVLSAVLQGQENMTRQSVAALAEKFVSSVITICLIIAHSPLAIIAGVGIISGAASLSINLSAFPGVVANFHWPSRKAVSALVMAGLPFIAWSVFRTLYGKTDPIIIGFFAKDTTIGWYAAADRLVGTMCFFPAAVTTALFPTLSALYVKNENGDFARLSRRLLSLILLVGIPAAALLICLPRQLIALLHYPSAFAGSIPVLRVAGPGVLGYFVAMALGTVVVASDGQNKMFTAAVWAAVLGIPACIAGCMLGARYANNAATGAMASDVILEVALIVMYLRNTPVGLFGRETFSQFARLGLAGAAMVGILLCPWGQQGGLWSVLPAIAVYLCLCWLLRCFLMSDVLMVREILLKRPTQS